MIRKFQTIERFINPYSPLKYNFAAKKIEVFINDKPYKVTWSNYSRLKPIYPYFRHVKKMELKFPDFAIMNDLK